MWTVIDRARRLAALTLVATSVLVAPTGVAAQDAAPGDPVPSAGCDAPAAEVPAMLSVSSGGLDREVLLHLPGGVAPIDPAPLVLAFHGYGSGPYDQEYLSDLSVVADGAGFVVAYPSGSGTPLRWDLSGDVDTAFVADLLEVLGTTMCLDERRIAATGFSMGGGLANVLGCRLADRIAAIAPVAGVQGPAIEGTCAPSRPVPVLAFHGVLDPAVPYAGGILPDDVWEGKEAGPVEAWAAAWAAEWVRPRAGGQPRVGRGRPAHLVGLPGAGGGLPGHRRGACLAGRRE
jgi:polyhydroxybutyrate depolymerase